MVDELYQVIAQPLYKPPNNSDMLFIRFHGNAGKLIKRHHFPRRCRLLHPRLQAFSRTRQQRKPRVRLPVASIVCTVLIYLLATKPAGAYRPPGARGLATPTIFKREDEGGAALSPSNGISNPSSRTGTPANGRHGDNRYVPGAGHRHRAVPGAPPPGSAPAQEEGKKTRKKKGKKDGGGDSNVDNAPLPAEVPPPVTVVAAPPIQAPVAEAPSAEGGLDPVAKKIRNLNKKVRFALLLRLRG